jgi:hypothetical protein
MSTRRSFDDTLSLIEKKSYSRAGDAHSTFFPPLDLQDILTDRDIYDAVAKDSNISEHEREFFTSLVHENIPKKFSAF